MSTAEKWKGLERIAEGITEDEDGAAVIKEHLAREFGPLLDAADDAKDDVSHESVRVKLTEQLEKFK